MTRIRYIFIFLAIVNTIIVFFPGCEKDRANRYAGTWDFENTIDTTYYNVSDTTTFPYPYRIAHAEFHHTGKIVCVDEEKHILRIIFNDKDTAEVRVDDKADLYGCFKLSHFCKYRGFHYDVEHGDPVGFFSDYKHLERLFMYSDVNHITSDTCTIIHIYLKGTKISK